MRKLIAGVAGLLSGGVLILAVAVGWLYFSDAALLKRYVIFFTPEDLTYANLEPRERVIGDASYQLPVASGLEKTISPEALVAMAQYAIAQKSHSLIVLHKGVVQLEWYAKGWDRGRLTQSQSMHKSVLPVLLQSAVEEGSIAALSDPVGKYIIEWQDDPRGVITIQQLMWMSSGLLEYPFSLNPFSDAFQWLFASNSTPVVLRTPLDWTPGEKFQYNNVNSELLGLIIERATGIRYTQYLQQKLWGPMGAAGAELWLDEADGKAHSSCCLLAPTMDWARFGMLLLGEGEVNGRRIVEAEFVRRMVSPSPTFEWYGYQIWLGYSRELNPRARLLAGGYQRTEPFLADDTFYTSGYGAQRVYVVPSEELVIVRMGPASGRQPVQPSWDNTFLVNTAIRGLSMEQ
jgi:CubicO group peptidase (beta-lactamase class C family)